MVIYMKKFGKILISRSLGFAARHIILDLLRRDQRISFDMSGVNNVSDSFADECFGKLLTEISIDEFKGKTSFINSKPIVHQVVTSAVEAGWQSHRK